MYIIYFIKDNYLILMSGKNSPERAVGKRLQSHCLWINTKLNDCLPLMLLGFGVMDLRPFCAASLLQAAIWVVAWESQN